MATETFQFTVTQQQEGLHVTHLLGQLAGQSKTQIKQAMSQGAVWLERSGASSRARRAKLTLMAGDKVTYHYAPHLLEETPPQLTPAAQEKDFSVWIKPRGMTVAGSRYCDHTALKRCIETQYPSSGTTYIVHRLDRFTAGLIVVAHNKSAAAALSASFRNHRVRKSYHCWITGALGENCTISDPLDGKKALSEVSVEAQQPGHCLVRVSIKTGRKHQVRRHLASIGHPILGDRLYGTQHDLDLQLAATHLAFEFADKSYDFCLDWRTLLSPSPQQT